VRDSTSARQRLRIDGEPVVLRGDLDLAGLDFFTGWLAPRWPNFSLNVSPPIARPRIWCPRQMPNTGTFDATSVFALSIA
jgi:hypothetical protein